MARMPQYLHQDVKVIGLDPQELLVVVMGYFVSITFKGYAIPVVMVLIYRFIKYKRSKPRGYLGHLFFRAGFGGFKNYPIATSERFYE